MLKKETNLAHRILLYAFCLTLVMLTLSFIIGVLLYLFESIVVVSCLLTALNLIPMYFLVCFVCIDIKQK